jgi:beta-glucosidase
LDDPVDGPVVGTVPVPAMGLRDPDPAQPRDWAEVTGRWLPAAATGVRDLYLVFDTPGVTVSWLNFQHDDLNFQHDDRSTVRG